MKKSVYVLMFLFILCISPSLLAKPTVEARGAILIEAKTNTILYEKNAYSKFYPASMTKLLTALIIEEQLAENCIITKSQNSVNTVPNDSSEIGLTVGDCYNKVNSLYGLLLGSDNFIAHDLALAHSGSISKFSELMNTRAKALGARNTHFTNPHGYHNSNHYTTPYDMAQIAKGVFMNPTVQKIAGTVQFNFHVTNKNKFIPIKNTSRLLKSETPYYNSAVVACKTGYHSDARQTLVAKAVYGDMELIAVVMYEETPNQYIDVNKLFDYAKTNYNVEQNTNAYTLINKTLPTWAKSSITKAVEKGWVSSATNYSDVIYTEDLVIILKKVGASYSGITMQEVYNLVGLKQGDLITKSSFAEIMTFAAKKWELTPSITSTKPLPSDVTQLSTDTKVAISYMINRDLMSTSTTLFNPNRTLTFAEAISTLCRMLPEK